VPYLVMYITSYSIRIVLLSRYVNIYDTMAPMSGGKKAVPYDGIAIIYNRNVDDNLK